MRIRIEVGALLAAGLLGMLTGCTQNQGLDSIAVTPGTATVSVGQTAQLTAMGTFGNAKNPKSGDVTASTTWTTSAPAVATVSATGLVTGVASGTATITASAQGWAAKVTSTATVTVGSGTSSGGDIIAVSLTPTTQTIALPGETANFLAIGTTKGGTTVNLTNSVAWASSANTIGTITSGGVATAVAKGTTTVTAIYTNADNTIATGSATLQVTGGGVKGYSALTMFPAAQTATSLAQQNQFTVLGTDSTTGEMYDLTSQVIWASTNASIATIGNTGTGTPGLATAVGGGTVTITAQYTNPDTSKVETSGTYTVTVGAAQEPLLSINIVPGATTVATVGQNGQFLAFGTFSTTPTVRDLTAYVQWLSLTPDVATINSNSTTGGQITATTGTTQPTGGNNLYNQPGLATASGYTGGAVIYAEATNPDGTVVLSNSQTFTCKDPQTQICDQTLAPSQFVTLTVFNAGPNQSSWAINAPSSTGTPNLIHCGPGYIADGGVGGSVCTGVYPYNKTQSITFIETAPAGSFGGWSLGSDCAEFSTAAGVYSNTCTVNLDGNHSVGAIFY